MADIRVSTHALLKPLTARALPRTTRGLSETGDVYRKANMCAFAKAAVELLKQFVQVRLLKRVVRSDAYGQPQT